MNPDPSLPHSSHGFSVVLGLASSFFLWLASLDIADWMRIASALMGVAIGVLTIAKLLRQRRLDKLREEILKEELHNAKQKNA